MNFFFSYKPFSNCPKKNQKLAKTLKLVKISKNNTTFIYSTFKVRIIICGLSFTLRPPQKEIIRFVDFFLMKKSKKFKFVVLRRA